MGTKKFAIALHGGAEETKRGDMSSEEDKEFREGLAEALQAGYSVLEKGGSALNAVEAAVKSMEDNPIFNAGKGGSLTERGETEFDAAIMDGKTLQAGAVGAVRYVKNPISLARAIMEKSKHVFMTATGAEEFALSHHLAFEGPDYFITAKKRKAWSEKQQKAVAAEHDTVGAVALDQDGNLAVATSTGGLTDQQKGRLGDSPIIGGGTYANNQVCAVSCTGDGEAIMRGVLAHEVYALMKYAGKNLQAAADEAVKVYDEQLQGDKGILSMDPDGNIAFAFNTNLMKRAWRKAGEAPVVALWEEEPTP